jgi:hypothetical protein
MLISNVLLMIRLVDLMHGAQPWGLNSMYYNKRRENNGLAITTAV